MDHSSSRIFGLFVVVLVLFASVVSGENIYELRQYTDQDWQRMSTSERLDALNTANNHATNQTFIGNFGLDTDLFPKWGYEYYEMEDRYENYSFRGYENYTVLNRRRQRYYYNQFGDRMTRMTSTGRIWLEQVNDDGTWGNDGLTTNGDTGFGGGTPVGPSGYINQVVYGTGVHVARESTDDWTLSIIGAGSIRKKLSPLTFSIPNINGMVADFQTANMQMSFVNYIPLGVGAQYGDFEGSDPSFSGTLMMRAGQVRRQFGALTLGFNYANMYAIQRNRDGGHGLQGTVSDMAPTPHRYLVRVLDDSPYDGKGPIVHDVRMIVNGRERPDIVPFVFTDSLDRDLTTALAQDGPNQYLDIAERKNTFFGDRSKMDYAIYNERMPKFADYLAYEDYLRGRNIGEIVNDPEDSVLDLNKANAWYKVLDPADAPFRADGSNYVIYMFDLSSLSEQDITRVQARVTVENDYKVQVAEIYQGRYEAREKPDGDAYQDDYRATYWKTMAQADGNVQDGSNLETVTVDFAYEVANTIYGMDLHFNYLGFKIDGEYVVNTHHYMFSDGQINQGIPIEIPTDLERRNGERSSITDRAYYLVAQKDWRNFGLTGEIFRMGKFYRPSMTWYGVADNQVVQRYNQFTMSMIEDNDDNDMYPDTMFASNVAGSNFATSLDPDGVFPGKDEDRDGIPDTDKNLNYVVDYKEPFMMFDADPDYFVFGDDLNNNNMPDFQEDDVKWDTPYDLDREGYHLNFRYSPQSNLNFVFGSMRTHGVGVDTRTNNDYFKTNFTYNVLDVGSIYMEYRYEQIKDNIADIYMITDEEQVYKAQGGWAQGARYESIPVFDELEYRNSRVNRLFVESLIRPISSITIENHVKYENNAQVEGTMYDTIFQPENTISTLAMSNKVVYTKQLGNFTFQPGIKFRFYKKDYEIFESPRDHYLMTIPLVYLKYRVSDNTNITLGIQGFKGIDTRYEDYVLARNSFSQRNQILQIENRTTYFGFEVWGAAGFQSEQVVFDEVFRKFEEYKSTSLFVRMWIGN